MMCKRCNIEYDRKEICRNGHNYSEVGFYVVKGTWRNCKACHKLRMKKYYAKKNSV